MKKQEKREDSAPAAEAWPRAPAVECHAHREGDRCIADAFSGVHSGRSRVLRRALGVLILQNKRSVSVELAEKLAEFVNLGLPVLFIGSTPEGERGYLEYQRKSELLRPYEADITEWVRAGENTLENTVVNTLFNALAARGADPNAFSGTAAATPGLMPSGLIGPVTLSAR